MDTLFELMLNPYLLPYHHNGILGHYRILTVFLLCFVIFGSFGMIALLTGVINEQMFEKNEFRNQELKAEREARHREVMRLCGAAFDTIQQNTNANRDEGED